MSSRYLRICAVATYGLLAACAVGEPVTEPLVLEATANAETTALPSFAPDTNLEAATQLAASRWSIATGLSIEVNTEGTIPVHLVPLILADADGNVYLTSDLTLDLKEKCGVFEPLQQVIYVSSSVDCKSAANTIAHEMGHALGCLQHTVKGLMRSAPEEGAPIDEEALTVICEKQDCHDFNPEEYCSNGSDAPATYCQVP